MLSLLVFNRVYRLEIQSVMLVFSTRLVYCCPSTFSLTYLPSQSKRTVYTDSGSGCGGVGCGRALSCVVDHILQEFNTVSNQIQNLQNCYTTPNKNDQ